MLCTHSMNEFNLEVLNGMPALVKVREIDDQSRLDTPLRVYEFMNRVYHLSKKTEEYMYLLCLSSKLDVLGIFEVSHGNGMSSFAGGREIFMRVLLTGCTGFILVHNHVSGDPQPSETDDKCTSSLVSLSGILGVQMMDHVIVGDNRYFSYKESDKLAGD